MEENITAVDQNQTTPPPMEIKKSNKKIFLIIILVFILILGTVAAFGTMNITKQTNTTKKIYHVGILSGLDFFIPVAEGFKSEMTKHGYKEGDTIVYDFEKTNVEPEKEKKILQKFIANKEDMVISFPTEVSILAKKELAQSKIPLIFTAAFTEQGNLINSVANTGGNLTGVRYPGPDVSAKRLEVIHQLNPNAKRILIPYLKGYPIVPFEMDTVKKYAQTIGVQIVPLAADGPDDLVKDFASRENKADIGIDAILFIPEPLTTSPKVIGIVDAFCLKHKIIYGGIVIPGAHGLFDYNPNLTEMGILTATIADKVLKGEPASSISVVTPSAYLRLNYKAAKELDIPMSDELLNSAQSIVK